MKLCSTLCIIMCAIFIPATLFAQKEATNWYFGDHAAVSFATGSPVALTNSAMSVLEGCATISDRTTGVLLFYASGERVWNAEHRIMKNGDSLYGHSSTSQGALIVPHPHPDSSYLYYIFLPGNRTGDNPFSDCNTCLHYSIVDMRGDGGRGEVIVKNIRLIDGLSEHLTAMYDCAMHAYWVVVKDYTSTFYAYHVTTQGIQPNPVISNLKSIEKVMGQTSFRLGCMKFSPNGKKLAVATYYNMTSLTDLPGLFQIMSFDRASGRFSDLVEFHDTIGGVTDGTYGVSFSPNSQLVYFASRNARAVSFVMQADANAQTTEQLGASFLKVLLDINGGKSPSGSALQLAPDGKIYISSADDYLASIEKPDIRGIGCDGRRKVVFLQGAEALWGLPNFIDNIFDTESKSSTPLHLSLGSGAVAVGQSFALPLMVESVANQKFGATVVELQTNLFVAEIVGWQGDGTLLRKGDRWQIHLESLAASPVPREIGRLVVRGLMSRDSVTTIEATVVFSDSIECVKATASGSKLEVQGCLNYDIQQSAGISVRPQPAGEEMEILLPAGWHARLYDAYGRESSEELIAEENREHAQRVRGLPMGMYVLEAWHDGEHVHLPVVVVR